MARFFVAAWPSTDVLDVLEALDRVEEAGVRWTSRHQWHTTLRFLGHADPDDVTAALSTIRSPVLTATVGPRVGRLGSGVIVVPVGGLDDLAAEVRSVTADIGAPPDPRPFAGHITLARLRDRDDCGLVGARIDVRFEVPEIALVASDTRPGGSRYTELARFGLGAR